MTSICSTSQHAISLCDWPISWADTGNFLSGVGTLVGAIAVFKAADAFEVWRRQKIGERHIEQAERTLTAMYEAKDALEYCRGIMTWEHELKAAKKTCETEPNWMNLTEEKQKRVLTAQAKATRLQNTGDQQKALVAVLPMAKALFGDALHNALTQLHRQFWVLDTYISAYLDDNGLDADFTKSTNEALFAGKETERNEISDIVTASCELIELICLPFLRLDGEVQEAGFRKWMKLRAKKVGTE